MTFVPQWYYLSKRKEEESMKQLFSFLICALFAATSYSQSLRVTFNGNRNYQLTVDGRNFSSGSYLDNDVVVNNLSGSHNVTVSRINRNGKTKPIYSSTVNLSPGEEVHLTVSNNGSIQREDNSSNAAYGYGYRSPMSDASFNEVYRNINNQWGQQSKMTTARDVFNTSTYYMTTDQVRQIIELLNSDANRLELLKLAYDNVTDPANYYRLDDLLRSQSNRNELDDYVRNNNYNGGYSSGTYNNGTSYGYRTPMSSSAFNQVYQDVSNQSSISRRLSAATRALNTSGNYFTVSQVRQLILLVSGENNRLQLAKLSMDNLVDPENTNQLYDVLSTQAARNELDNYIRNNGYPGGGYNNSNGSYNNNYHSAMSETDFNNLYNSIRKRWLPFTKYSAAVDAFSSSENYFTTAQAKDIIALLSSEDNRLQLAKMAFDNIVDQQNFRQLYDLFTSQSSKDELDSYIRTNYNYQY
jgi:hypothetical protein